MYLYNFLLYLNVLCSRIDHPRFQLVSVVNSSCKTLLLNVFIEFLSFQLLCLVLLKDAFVCGMLLSLVLFFLFLQERSSVCFELLGPFFVVCHSFFLTLDFFVPLLLVFDRMHFEILLSFCKMFIILLLIF